MIQVGHMTLPQPTIPRTDTTIFTPVSMQYAHRDITGVSHALCRMMFDGVCVLFHFPPVDHSRVILSVPDGWGSDYINASYINVGYTLHALA